MSDSNGSTHKVPKKKRKHTLYEYTNPEREAQLRALRAKFPNYSDIKILQAAVETLFAFTYTGSDRISRRDQMRILEDFWPTDEFKVKYDGDE